ncbi:MAG: hypothetical protein ACFFA3_13480 [Promethearchaeota archaeon]
MAVLEIGINLGLKKLLEIKYYSSADKILDPNIRNRFLSGLEDYINEVFGDEIYVISLSNFEIICYYEMVQTSKDKEEILQPLLVFAIIEKKTDHEFVLQHLKKIYSLFLKKYDLKDIFTKGSKFFKKFKPQVDEILGDLRIKLEDRIRTVFRD